MTKQQFTSLFRKLEASYPTARLDHRAEVFEVYFDGLKFYEPDVVSRAITEAATSTPGYFPSLGVFKQCCEAAKSQLHNMTRKPAVKYQPHDHAGCVATGRQEMDTARRLLFEISPYEGYHVLCRGEMIPRCPWCGIDVAPFLNPSIQKLIDMYPRHTQDWNPLHKGNLPCSVCAQIRYPEGFMQELAQ